VITDDGGRSGSMPREIARRRIASGLYAARAAADENVIDLIQERMRTDHPDLVGKVSREDLKGWIEEG
jgi:hypothetical protein